MNDKNEKKLAEKGDESISITAAANSFSER